MPPPPIKSSPPNHTHMSGGFAGGKAPMNPSLKKSNAKNHTHMSGGFAGGKATMIPSLIKLIARIENSVSSDVSLKDVRVLANLKDPEAIDALAGLLDDEGRVGREAVRALTRFGRHAEPTLRRCLKSHNPRVVEHARQLLSALGNVEPIDDAALAAVAEEQAQNDNQDPEVQDFAILADPEIVRAIAGTLFARGVPKDDLDDGVAEVQARVLEVLRIGPPPTAFADWRALANKVAAAFAVDTVRKRIVRRKNGDEFCEDPDSYTNEQAGMWDPMDARAMVRVFKEMLEAGELPPLTGEILERTVAGKPDIEIAKEFGLSRSVIRDRRLIVRGRFGSRLAALGMADLIPARRGQKENGEAAPEDDLPATLLRDRHR